jgi:cellulose synthase/poly-beta-1,6-N-acetylglucosamine synthase-like glycosyltransferase
METLQQILRIPFLIQEENFDGNSKHIRKSYGRRIIISGFMSLLLLMIIIYTLPKTVLSVASLLEYSIIVSLVLFLVILLVRYFMILVLSYLYVNEYTFLEDNNYSPFVSIVVPVHNESRVLKQSINSLLNLNYKNYEIIIVNDGSTDDTQSIAEEFVGYNEGKYAPIKITLINKKNAGKSTALNAGIKYSTSDFVLCMDGDSQLAPNSLRAGIRHFKNSDIGAVAGNVKVLNRKRFLTDLQSLEYIEGLNMARSAQSFIRAVNIIPGPIGLFRRSAINQAGFYSSDTFAEDADLTLKILANGWKIYYEPQAISYTEAPEKFHQLLKQRYRWTRGIIQSIRKHKKLLINPTINFRNTAILWSMFYEALIWPPMNIAAHLFFIIAALAFGFSSLIIFWWIALALLDFISALYCIVVEREEARLLPYTIIYRMFFILVIDICKAMSTVEEFLGIRMTWGKLERTGT